MMSTDSDRRRSSRMPILNAGLAARGRSRESFEISGGGFVVTGKDDAAVAKLFDWVRYRVAFYGSTPAYWPVFEVHGLGDLGRKLNAMMARTPSLSCSTIVALRAPTYWSVACTSCPPAAWRKPFI